MPDPAQPRPAHGRPHRRRGLLLDVLSGAVLPHPGRRPVDRRAACRSRPRPWWRGPPNSSRGEPGKGWLPWQALRRKLDREQPEYRNDRGRDRHGRSRPVRASGGEAVVAGLGATASTPCSACRASSSITCSTRSMVPRSSCGSSTRVTNRASAYMALGYAQATGRPAVYAGVPGPGFLNTAAALSTAYALHAPRPGPGRADRRPSHWGRRRRVARASGPERDCARPDALERHCAMPRRGVPDSCATPSRRSPPDRRRRLSSCRPTCWRRRAVLSPARPASAPPRRAARSGADRGRRADPAGLAQSR